MNAMLEPRIVAASTHFRDAAGQGAFIGAAGRYFACACTKVSHSRQ
jgi:hypothetical protein